MFLPWLFLASLTVIGITVYNISVRIGGETVNAFVFTTVLTLTALLAHSAALMTYKLVTKDPNLFVYHPQGMLFAVAAGVSVAVIDLAYFFAVKYGSLSATTTFWMVGGIALTAIVSFYVFKEVMTPMKMLGLALGLVSIIFIVKG